MAMLNLSIHNIVKYTTYFLFGIMLISCAAVQQEFNVMLLKKGHFDGPTYINSFYGFRISGPMGWNSSLSFVHPILGKFISQDNLSDIFLELVTDDPDNDDTASAIIVAVNNYESRHGTKVISSGELTERDGIKMLEQTYRKLDFKGMQVILRTRFIKGPGFVLILTGLSHESSFAKIDPIFKKIFGSLKIDPKKWFIGKDIQQKETGTALAISKPEPKPVPKPVPKPEPIEKAKTVDEDYVHTILWEGETLSLISLWYTDHIINWEKIAAHNNIKENEMLQIDQQIIIPRSLIVNDKPLSKEWLEQQMSNIRQKRSEESKENSDIPVQPIPSSPPQIHESEPIEKIGPVGPKM